MTKLTDIVGIKFSRLTVIRRNGWNKHGHTTWDCKCECGRFVPNIPKGSLVTGNTRSCGCIERELLISRNKSHGKTNTPLYRVYAGMRSRCMNSKASNYHLYGGRGIKCLWEKFEDFDRDMGKDFKNGLTIERKDNDGNYCKENCKWADGLEQANNTRRNHRLTFNGKTQTLTQWAREIDSTQERIRARLKRGFTPEQALTFKKNQYRI